MARLITRKAWLYRNRFYKVSICFPGHNPTRRTRLQLGSCHRSINFIPVEKLDLGRVSPCRLICCLTLSHGWLLFSAQKGWYWGWIGFGFSTGLGPVCQLSGLFRYNLSVGMQMSLIYSMSWAQFQFFNSSEERHQKKNQTKIIYSSAFFLWTAGIKFSIFLIFFRSFLFFAFFLAMLLQHATKCCASLQGNRRKKKKERGR